MKTIDTVSKLGDTLKAAAGAARAAGLTTPAGRGALSGSRDASAMGLKFFQALGLDKAAEAPERPGRPGDTGWSAMRGGRAAGAL